MNYFCRVILESAADQTKDFYMVLEKTGKPNNLPILTKEILSEQHEYKDFVMKYRPKLTAVRFTVYETEKEVHANFQPEKFEELISERLTRIVSNGELQMERSDSKPTGHIRKKKKGSPLTWLLVGGGTVIVGLFGVLGGMKLGRSQIPEITTTENPDTAEDGLIIPKQEEIEDGVEQRTVTIDRSYSAVPMEDLQLKGAVVNGKASITLPEFDKEDFFTHVAGHTWGFTSDPNGKKIEYYGGRTYEFASDTKLYRVLVKYGGGSGTKDDPYLIDYFDQLELMGEEKARGYFKQTADIYFPSWSVHTPIKTVNELKADPTAEYFEYDGGGYSIKNLTAPLFDQVSGALIQNVNIISSAINSPVYRDYGFIVCNAYNYHYTAEDGKVYETGETIIKHCTVSHSSITAEIPKSDDAAETTTAQVVTAPEVVPPDIIEYDDNGNPIETTTTTAVIEPTKIAEHSIGAISGNGGQIEDCYVTDFGIYANLTDYFLYAGGISGKPALVTNSAVYYYSASGNIFNAGGIAGSAAGARAYDAHGRELPDCYGGSIQGCTARNIILNSELSAGGIAAEGSTDSEGAMISNCYANELHFNCGEYEDTERMKLVKEGVCGGVIAVDGAGKYGHLITNTVSLSDFSVIGNRTDSKFDETVRLAPAYAFYQENILTVINRNTVNVKNPKEIFTGTFMFGEQGEFGDESGNLPYPEQIKDLFAKTWTQEGA